MESISNVIYAMQICTDRHGHCKSCPYNNPKDPEKDAMCDIFMARDAIQYLQELRIMKEKEMNSSVGVPVLPIGYINNEEIKEPERTLDEVISAFEACRKVGTCEECPYREDDICGETFGNDARLYLEKYRESLNNGK